MITSDTLEISEMFRMDFQCLQTHHHAMNSQTDVALILWNEDLIDLMSFVLQEFGMTSFGLEPFESRKTIEDTIALRKPCVIIFDLDPPYERSAATALELIDRFADCSFLMTCADPLLAFQKAPWLCGQAIFEKPYDVLQLAASVHLLVRRTQRLAKFAVGV